MGARRSAGASAIALTLTLCLPMMACADGASKSAPAKTPNPHASMKVAPMKANGSGVDVSYRIDAAPEAGRAIPVVLSFGGVTDPAGGTVRLTVDAGLSLGAAAALYALPANQVTTLTVEVVPGAAGIGYLNVFTTQHGITGATSIPVQVGKAPAAMPASGELKQTPAGDKILSMPVK